MKKINDIIGTAAALAGILCMIYLGINLFLVQDAFLNYTNAKYGIAESLVMSEEDLQRAVHSMISYVKGEMEDAQVIITADGVPTPFFNEKELIHLTDVRGVLDFLETSMTMLLVFCVVSIGYLIYKKRYLNVVRGIFFAWGIMLVVTLFIALVAMEDINQIVVGFHELFFTNDLWLLNPATDRSVWMFKNEMYSDALIYIAAIVGVVAAVTLGGAVLVKKKLKCDYESIN